MNLHIHAKTSAHAYIHTQNKFQIVNGFAHVESMEMRGRLIERMNNLYFVLEILEKVQ
jgi:hypothetical protein